MADDYTLPSKTRLVNLINEDNGGAGVDEAQLSIGTPEPTTEYGRNTKVLISAISGAGLTGSRHFYYNRLNINTMLTQVSNNDKYVRVDNPTNTWDLLPSVLALWGIRLDPVDVRQDPVTGNTATIRIKSTSLGWMGQVSVQVLPTIKLLSNILTTTALTGFNYEDDWPLYANADMYSPGAAQLLSLINSNNGTTLTFDDVEFSELTETLEDPQGRNTSVKVTAKPDRDVEGFVVLTYTRVDPALALPDGLDVTGNPYDYTTTLQVLVAARAQHGIELLDTEILDEPLGSYPATAALEISATSYVWAPHTELTINLVDALGYLQLDDNNYLQLDDGSYLVLD